MYEGRQIVNLMLVAILISYAAIAAHAQLAPPSEFGNLVYPAKGNIQLDEGTLDLWVISQFDTDCPAHKTDADQNWRALLFELVLPDDKAKCIIHYISWANCFAMVGYVNPPQPYVMFGPPQWKPGEEHHVVFAWSGPKRSVFIDGVCEWQTPKTQGPINSCDVDVQGNLHGDLTSALIYVGGNYSHLAVDEIQIRNIALTREEIVKAKDAPLVADARTLLLDHCDGSAPEIIGGQTGETAGTLSGTHEIIDGKFGKAIKLWRAKK